MHFWNIWKVHISRYCHFLLENPSNRTFQLSIFRQEVQDSLKHDAFSEPHETDHVLYLFYRPTSPAYIALNIELSFNSFTRVQILLCLTKMVCGTNSTETKLKQPKPLLHLPSHPSCGTHHPHREVSELHVKYLLSHHNLQIIKLSKRKPALI